MRGGCGERNVGRLSEGGGGEKRGEDVGSGGWEGGKAGIVKRGRRNA